MSAPLPFQWIVLIATFVVAIGLTIVPLPQWVDIARPEWVALTMIYWCMAMPWRVSIGTAWCLGLLLDVLQGATLGQHALALVLVAYLIQRFYLQLRSFPVWQQSLVVMLLLLVYKFPLFWISGMSSRVEPVLGWQAVIASGLLWPWVFALLRGIRRHYELA
ncbi:MAG: rod shape-determining protein MreD [Pseudomonadota bacterium]|nr:rod shape-determining protein MreD [Pseudomonadota bacterium]